MSGLQGISRHKCLREFVGYIYTGNHRLVNFFGGIELVQGFTQGIRSYNFDQYKADHSSRFDMLIGLQVGWIMPFYKEAPAKFYTY